MVDTQFVSILRDFAAYFKSQIGTDVSDSCLVKIPDSVEIQIQMDIKTGKLLVMSRLGVLQGGFKNRVLQEALKANEFYDPSTGSFGLGKSNNLILSMQINIDTLNPDKINAIMTPFIAKAKLWADGIKSGHLPPMEELETKTLAPSPFGMK